MIAFVYYISRKILSKLQNKEQIWTLRLFVYQKLKYNMEQNASQQQCRVSWNARKEFLWTLQVLKNAQKGLFLISTHQFICFFRYPVFNNEICAGLQTSNGDIRGFKGDINFGAALICYEKNDFLQNKPILAGIASRKHWSPNHDSPGMYTNIFKVKKSIQKKLGKNYTDILQSKMNHFHWIRQIEARNSIVWFTSFAISCFNFLF